ncbi:MAG: branched-chain amino acid ABC transporter ATP-binding protein/permease [Minwuiales bacterium]|nr:branched-chain amino acid ABC transporter ATP-binding protein/permease [Minwuiales bacterium]
MSVGLGLQSGMREVRAFVGAAGLAMPLLLAASAAALLFGAAEERILIVFLINLIAVVGIGVYTGNSGILSFGHVAFMGLGAYFSAWLTMPPSLKSVTLPNLPGFIAAAQMDLFAATLIVAGVVALIALIVGLPIARLNGSAAAIATLGLLVIVHGVIIGAKDFTRGSQSFFGVPRDTTLWIALAWAMVAVLAARLFRDSVPGLQLRAAREDELAARSMGVDVVNRRLAAWVVSAALMAVAGALLGHCLGTFSPKKFYFVDTFALLAMLIVGGMTTVSGAVGGTVLITLVIEVLRRMEGGGTVLGVEMPTVFGMTQVGLSLAILLVMYKRRAGLLGMLEWDEGLLRRGAVSAAPPAGEEPPPVEPTGSLEARQVSKNFDGLIALDKVDLALKPGEIVGLIGPNGSGKTTLLNTMSGALAASGGAVAIDGRDITQWPAHRIARHGLGRTFQNIRLFGELTVRENVEVGAMARWPGVGQRRGAAIAQGMLNAMGLTAEADRVAGTLPYGAQRRLEIARAMALQPRYLLLDEPAAGMNPAESDALLADLADLRSRRGIGLLVVDHDLRLIMRLCDRIVVLNKGQVIAEGSPSAVQSHPAVIEAYLGRKRQ